MEAEARRREDRRRALEEQRKIAAQAWSDHNEDRQAFKDKYYSHVVIFCLGAPFLAFLIALALGSILGALTGQGWIPKVGGMISFAYVAWRGFSALKDEQEKLKLAQESLVEQFGQSTKPVLDTSEPWKQTPDFSNFIDVLKKGSR